MYMEQPSKTNRKKKKKDKKVVKVKALPRQIISQKVSIKIGDEAMKRKRKQSQPKKRKEPFVVYQQTPIPLFTSGATFDAPPPPPPPPRPPPPPPPARATTKAPAKASVKAPVKVPDFPSRVLNDQTPSREEILSRKELKAKVEEKEPVVVSKQSETRSLLSDAVDKMVGIKDILKQASTPLEPRPAPAPPPAPPQPQAPPQDKRTQKLLPQGGPRFSNLTPQEVSKKIAEVKEAKEAEERIDKRSQSLQIQQLFGTLGEPYFPSALEKSVFRDVERKEKQLIGSYLSPPTLGQPDVASAVLGSSDETKDETPFV
jgi:hypothetical protein